MIKGIIKEKNLEIAVNAALKAGSELHDNFEYAKEIDFQGKRDIKIKGDKYSETIIIDCLQKQTDYPILSEERGFTGKPNPDMYIWIVDPLDGSVNYAQGIPLNCVSIALWKNDEPVLGVVYDFNRDEVFTGICGKGAWLNGQKIVTSAVVKTTDAIICTGFPVNTDFTYDGIATFVNSIRDYKKVRLFGSAALSLAYVGAGRVDAYFEKNIMFWDIAGGVAIVSAAGGKCDVQKSKKENAFNVYVSNGLLNL